MKGKPAPKINAKQLFQLYEDYYQHEIFNIKSELELMVYSEIVKVDSSAIALDTDILDRELTALSIELFGLAWFDHNYELYLTEKQGQGQSDSALCTEITFTKSYLEQTKNGDIWSAAGFYNDTMMQAAIAQETSRDWSIPRDIPLYYERGVNQSAGKEAKLMLDSFQEHFNKLLSDKDCLIRLSNRAVSCLAWRDGIMIPQKLSSAFAQRFSFSPNTEALLLLQRLTVGLYSNARNYINAVNDYGSWKLARKAAEDLRQTLFKAGRKLLEKQNGSDVPALV